MKLGTLVLSGSLANINVVIINAAGEIRVFREGDTLLPGEVILYPNGETEEASVLSVARVDNANEPQNITDDVNEILAALEQGQDPTLLDGELAPAAGGQSGSSLTSSGTVSRDGSETIASTNFVTEGFASLGLSETQSLTLLDQFRLAQLPPEFVDINESPLGESITVSTDEDTSISGQLIATDVNDDELTFSTATPPSNGQVTVNPDGSWTYTPDEDFDGNDSFTVVVTDGEGGSDEIEVIVVVNPIPEISVTGGGNVSEGDDAVFTIEFDKPSNQDTTLKLDITPTTAESDDIGNIIVTTDTGIQLTVAPDGTVVVPAGVTNLNVNVETVQDDTYEGDESFILTVDAVDGLVNSENTDADATITDGGENGGNDDRPTVSITETVSVSEGDDAVFTVSLSQAADTDVTVNLASQTGSASSDDFGTMVVTTSDGTVVNPNTDGSYTIPAGQTNLTVTIPTTNDTVFEGNEDFTVTATAGDGTVGSDTGTATITDGGENGGNDDRPIISITETVSVSEGDDAVFTVSLSQAADTDVTVNLASQTGSASSDDFGTMVVTTSDGTVVNPNTDGSYTIPAGETNLTVTIPTTDDTVFEGNEDFTVTATAGDGTVGSDTGTATITDGGENGGNDDRPTVSITETVSVSEGDDAVFTVSLSQAADTDVTVNLASQTGSASSDDFGTMVVTTADGTVVNPNTDGSYTIPAGETNLTVTIPTTNDTVFEGNEDFTVTATAGDGTVGSDTGTATITDGGENGGNDDRPTISITETVSVSEGDDAVFTVSLSQAADTDVTVNLASQTGSASSDDFGTMVVTTVDGTVVNPNTDGSYTIPAGETNLTVTIPTTDDTVFEGNEDFTVTATAGDGTVGSDTGTATITDGGENGGNDDRPTVSITETVSVSEGDDAVFTVSLSQAADTDVTVNLASQTGSASSDDFGTMVVTTVDGTVVNPNTDGSYTIPAGQTNLTVTIPTTDDTVFEGNEDFTVTATAGDGTVGSDTGTATITDGGENGGNDDRPTISITETVSVSEGDDAVFTVSLSQAADTDVTVNLASQTGSASSDDFGTMVVTTVDGTVVNPNTDGSYTIPAGQTNLTVTIPTTDDTVFEGNEDFTVTATAGDGTVGSDTGTATITDGGENGGNDDRPTVSITETVSVSEGDDAVFTVSLSQAADTDVTVNLASQTGSASSDDFGTMVVTTSDGTVVNPNTDGSYTIPAGETNLTVTIPTTDDTVFEGNEDFTVTATAGDGTVGSDTGTATITDGGENGGNDDRPTVSITETVSVSEGDDAVFTVSLSQAADTDVTVNLASQTGSASSDDFGTMVVTTADGTVVNPNTDGSYTIPAGQTNLTVTIPTTNDTVFEGNEDFTVTATAGDGTVGSDTGTATITDGGENGGNDDRPTVSITETVSVSEGDDAVFTVSLSQAADTDVTVNLASQTGSASSDDFGTMVVTTSDGTVVNPNTDGSYTIPAGETNLTVTIPTTDDTVFEGNEDFTVTATAGDGTVGSDTGTATITDGGENGGNDDRPTVSITETVSVSEGDDAVFTVSLSQAADTDVTVNLASQTGSAEADDFGTMVVTTADGTVVNPNTDGSYTIPAGQTNLTVTIPTTNDTVFEGNEDFTVTATAGDGTVGSDTGTATITDGGENGGNDDRPTVSITETVSVSEGDDAVFTVSLSQAADTDVTVNLASQTGSAEADDFGTMVVTTADGTVVNPNTDGSYTIPAGQTNLTVTIPTTNDTVFEGNEDFTVTATAGDGTVGSDTGTATITDGGENGGNDDRPTVSITETVSVSEGDDAVFTVSLSQAADTDVTVNLASQTGSASSDDFGTMVVTTADGTVVNPNTDGSYTIPAGQTNLTVTIPTTNDTVFEGNEDFTVTATAGDGTVGSDTGTATITDGGENGGNDDRPTVSITETVSVSEGDDAVFTVSLSQAADTDVTVNLASQTGSASSDDFGAMVVTTADGTVVNPNTDGSYTIPAGQTNLTVTIPTTNDTVFEGNEDFTVTATAGDGTVGSDTGTATITDGGENGGNDDRPTVSITETVSVSEGDDAVFTVSLSQAADTDVTVNLASQTGSASSDDFGAMVVTTADGTVVNPNTDGSYTIPAGQTNLTVTIPTTNDTVFEGNEDFTVTATAGDGTVGSDTGTATITDGGENGGNDDRPTISITETVSVSEGDDAVFTVSLSQAADTDVTVNLASQTGSASSDDFGTMVVTTADGTVVNPNTDGSYTIPAGQTNLTVTIPTTNDTVFEGNEDFTVTATAGDGTVGSDTGTATITDGGENGGNDDRPTVSITETVSVSEGDDAVFTVSLSQAADTDVTVNLASQTGSASSDDFGAMVVTTADGTVVNPNTDGSYTIPAGQTNLTVTIPTTDDTVFEGNEDFTVTATAGDGTVGSDTGTATITDGGENGGNDDRPTVSITETVSVSEGDDAVFTVSLSQAADTDVTVNLASQTGSASSDDFGTMVVTTADGTVVNPNTDGSYTIPAGQTNLTVTIPTTNDTVFEGNEDFTVTATAGDGTVGSDTGTATITDGGENGGNDDRPTISITETVSVSEGDDAVFTVSLSQAADTDVTVNLASQTGSAEADDFGTMVVTTVDGTVVNPNTDGSYTIPAGETNLTVTIPTTDDTVFEGNEDFTVTATAGDGTVGSDTGTATITDGGENGGNDDRPTISITETVSVSEGDDAVFTVSLSQAADTDVTVNLASQTGSAEADDFGTMVVTTADGTVVNPNTDGSYTIPAGQTNLTVTIPTTNDTVFEGNEDFTVTATAGDGTVGSDTGTATITDGGENGGNDDRPTISITETVSVSEGDDAVFTVSLSQAADTDVTVNLASQTGSASSDDFGTMVVTTVDGTVVNPNTDGSYTIPAGQTNLTVTIPTTDDTVFEGNEDFTVTATAGDGTVGSDTGTATITDGGENGGNDDRPTISITETVSVSEGDDAVFTVSLSQAADTDVTVNLASQTGSASSDDFGTMVVTTVDGTVVNPNTDGSYTIPAGQTNLTVTIPTTDDTVFEGNEDFTVTATAGDGTVGSDTGTATITDGGENGGNDDRPTVSITETVSVSEGDDAVFTVSLSQAADTDVTVNLASQTGSASSDDFGTMVVTTVDGTVVNPNTDGSYTIPAGQTNLTVTIPTTDDTVFEGNEDFTVTATAGDGTVGSDTGTATITDGGENGGNDDRPTISITETVSVSEGDDAVFTVSLSQAADTDVTVNLASQTGSASSDDFGTMVVTTVDGTVVNPNTDGSYTIPAGQTNLTVTIPTTDDTVFEGNEDFTVTATAGDGTVGSDTGTATITDGGENGGNDDRPTISITETVSVSEGDDAVFTVSLSQAADTDVTVNLASQTGSASSDDFGTMVVTTADGTVVNPNTDGSYTIPAGETNLTVTIPTTDDTVFEGNEDFTVTATAGDGTVGSDTGTATITDGGENGGNDDRPTVSITETVSVSEGDDAVFTVSLSQAADTDVTVNLASQTGSASSDDFGAMVVTTADGTVVNPNTDGSYTIPAGQTNLTVTIPTTNDTVFEGNEDFTVTATAGDGTVGSDTGTATITDGGENGGNDDRPTVSITETVSVSEGDDAVFTVSLSQAADTDVTVNLASQTGSASSDDFGAMVVTTADGTVVNPNTDGSYTIPAGQTNLTVTIPTTNDTVFEGNEDFTVTATAGDGTVGSDTGTATITDGGENGGNDDRPTVSITETVSVSEGDDAVFTVSLSQAADTDVTVNLASQTGSASSDDFGAMVVTTADGTVVNPNTDGSYTIPAGQTNLTVTIPTTNDTVFEGNEDFTVTATAGDGTVGSDTGTATITDGGENGGNDDRPTISITETVSVSEGDDAVFTVSLSQAADTDVTVNLASQTGSASSDDFGTMVVTTADGTVVNPNTDGSYTIPAGQTNLTVTIPTTNDTVFEGNEDFTVTATAGDGTVGSDTGTATITDGGENGGNDDRPTVSITETVSVSEGDDAVFTVSLSQAADTDVTVNLASQTGSASSDDFGAMVVTTADGTVVNPNTDGSYTIPAGQTNLTVTIPTTNDTVFEGNEDFTVTATAGDGAVGSDTGTATITDGGENGGNDDRPTVSITETVSVSEGDDAVFTVSLSQAADTDVTVNLASQTGSAEADDFGTMVVTTVDGTVVNPNTDGSYTIPAGQTNLTVTIPTTNDTVFEGNEDFTVTATAGDGTVGSDTGTATIIDNDAPPTITSIQGSVVSEEGLADGIADSQGSSDTTNSASASGSFVVGDVDSDTLSVSLTGPTGLMSGGESIVWSWDATSQTLVGSTSSLGNVAEISLSEPNTSGKGTWNYDIALSHPIDHPDATVEDTVTFNFSIVVSDGQVASTGDLTIVVEDDRPVVTDSSAVNVSLLGPNETPIASSEGNLQIEFGADGFGSLKLTGAESSLQTADGSNITISIDSQNPNRLLGRDENGELVFDVQLTPATGKWEYLQYKPMTNPQGDGDIDFTFTAVDGDGDSVTGAFAVNPYMPPSVGDLELNVSEEGLSLGIVDDQALEGHSDTTNSVTDAGTVSLSGHIADVTLGTPTDTLTSDGATVTWTLSSDGKTLTGSASGEDVITISVDNNGQVSTQLSGGIDHSNANGEDSLTINVPINVEDQAGINASGNIAINVEDDSPVAERIHHDVDAETKVGANVQLVLDISGSMNWDAETGSSTNVDVSRLQVMKDAAIEMLNQYQALGDTKVQIVVFSYTASVYSSGSSVWVSVEDAIDYIESLGAGGGTDYDTALWRADNAWDDNQGNMVTNGSNISYFLSDGEPTGSDNGDPNSIQSDELKTWVDHLKEYDVTALAYGIGENLDSDQLDLVAYDGFLEVDSDAIMVPDVNDLPPVLLQSVVQDVGGNLLSSHSGGDGAIVKSITIEGVTFTFNGSSVSQSGTSSMISSHFDSATNTLSIYVDSKHSLVIDMDDGNYTFYGAADDRPVEVNFNYKLEDNDGDSSESILSFEIDGVNVTPDIKSEGDVVDTVQIVHANSSSEYAYWSTSGISGTGATTESFTHQETINGMVVDVGAAGDDVFMGSGDDTIYLGDSHANIDDHEQAKIKQDNAQTVLETFSKGNDGDFLEDSNVEDSAMSISGTSNAFVDLGHGGGGDDHIYGQGGVDIMFGGSGDDVLDGGEGNDGLRGGSGNDRLVGGAGNDILIGGTGDDLLTGGEGYDIFKWVDEPFSVHEDVITDFNRQQDQIDLSELLTEDETMDDLLASTIVSVEGDINSSSADLKLTVEHDGDTQVIVLQDAASQFSDYISSNDMTGLLNELVSVKNVD